MQNEKNIIGRNIQAFRRFKNITQKNLAEKIGVKYQNLGAWERGKHIPPAKYIPLLAKALGITIDQLTTDNSNPTTSSPVQDVVAEDTRLKLIIQYLEKIIGLLEPPTTEEKEKLISQERSTPSPERKMGQD